MAAADSFDTTWEQDQATPDKEPTTWHQVVPTQPMVQTKTHYTTAVAVQQPRSLKQVEARFIQECAFLGDEAYYGWGAGKDRIEGPSVELAMALLRSWGNAAVEFGPVQETPTSYLFTAYFVDIETGTTVSRPFRQSRQWQVYGKMDPERKEDIRFQIGASKAARNVILNAVPSWLVDRGMSIAKEGARKKITTYIEKNGINAAQQLILSLMLKLGVTEDRVLAKVGKSLAGALTVEDMTILQGDLKALQNGAESPIVLFPEIVRPVLAEKTEPKPDPQAEPKAENPDEKKADSVAETASSSSATRTSQVKDALRR